MLQRSVLLHRVALVATGCAYCAALCDSMFYCCNEVRYVAPSGSVLRPTQPTAGQQAHLPAGRACVAERRVDDRRDCCARQLVPALQPLLRWCTALYCVVTWCTAGGLRCIVLRCDATCQVAFKHVATCCTAMQHGVPCCNVLYFVATDCTVSQCGALCCSVPPAAGGRAVRTGSALRSARCRR